jgi:hypothetical protein
VCTGGNTAHISVIYLSSCHTRVNMGVSYSSLLQWSVPLGQRGHVAMVRLIPGLWHILKEKKSQGRKLAWTRSASSSAVNEWPFDFCLHRHPVSVNCLYHAGMVLSVDGSFAYFARNARCTVTTDLLVWYSDTQNDFSPRAAIFSLHTLASPSGRNVNYDKRQLSGGDWVVPSVCTGFVNTCPAVFLS